MPDEAETLASRATAMANRLETEHKWYLRSARINYAAVQVMSFGSSAAGVAAALLGLIPSQTIEKWQVGLVAAISTALIAASRQAWFSAEGKPALPKVRTSAAARAGR